MPSTAICRELGIEHPILSVGFAAAAGPELAAAVSNAGGLGVIGASGMPPDFLRERIARTRELTDRPFGANLIIAADDPEDVKLLLERHEAIVAERISLIVLFAGDPAPFVEPAQQNGVRIAIQVGSPAEARRAAEAGVDMVIAQGVESGGHISSRTSLFVNLPTIVDVVSPLPVLASGGIADGRGLAAALMLGAQGVSLGTRFVASEEAFIPDEYKQRVIDADAEDTYYSEDLFDVFWPGMPHRTLKARTYEEWNAAGRPPSGDRPHEGEPIGLNRSPYRAGEVPRYASYMLTPWFEGEVELGPMWAGESVALVDAVLPAGDIVRRIAAEADEVLARVSGGG